MKKSLIALAAAASMGAPGIVRARTHDISYGYRMGGGFAGDVNRTHPASVVAGLMNATNPAAFYGYPVIELPATNDYRGVLAADQGTVTTIAGVLVRPFPVQQVAQTSMNAPIGATAAPTSGVIDVLDEGFILVSCPDFAVNAPAKGKQAFVWAAATAGNKLLGGFVAAASAGNTIALTNAEFTGPADATGICELRVWKGLRT